MLWPIIAVAISSLLLVFAYPKTSWFLLAWFAMVPWLCLVEQKSYRAAFGWSYLVGLIFFSGTLFWFFYVTPIGAVCLMAYLSLYFAAFGVAYRFFRPFPPFLQVIVLPAFWVSLEFIRAHAISGFNWVSLAHSQTANLALIQIADVTGFYGVSFLVAAVNVVLALLLSRQARAKASLAAAQAVVLVFLALALVYGVVRVKTWPDAHDKVSVGVVQPNINQDMKWDQRFQNWIVQKTLNASYEVAKEKPDLIVWPETSLPSVFSQVPALVSVIANSAQDVGVPILVGAITDEHGKYFNSAYLINAQGEVENRYDKMHLVPFGEYMPYRAVLGWINNIVGLEDFTPGRQVVLFKTGQRQVPFSVLICFEDSVGYLGRHFTLAGAKFFVNMTNDAWFYDTKAPYIHLSSAILTSVENKRSLVRSANTGISAVIDPLGRVQAIASGKEGKQTFVDAKAVFHVPISDTVTFYTKYSDLFTYLCFFVILWAVIQRRRYVTQEDTHYR